QCTMPSPLSAAAVSPNGKVLVVARDDGALVWLDAHSGTEIHRRASPATGAIVSVQFSPTESRIAVGGVDGKVRLLAAGTGEELLVREGLSGRGAVLAFFRDGRQRAASAAGFMRGGGVGVWDGRRATEPPPLPAPDAAWHRARLAIASGRSGSEFGPPAQDPF